MVAVGGGVSSRHIFLPQHKQLRLHTFFIYMYFEIQKTLFDVESYFLFVVSVRLVHSSSSSSSSSRVVVVVAAAVEVVVVVAAAVVVVVVVVVVEY
jgi:hypothetical protein